MKELYEAWMKAKEVEAKSVEERRELEDAITKKLALDEQHEGSKTVEDHGFKVKITQRLSKKIDADALQDIAAQEGLGDHLSTLFRWKPEINKKLWDAADESITRPLSDAITVKAGRPSYSITKEEV